MYLNWIRSRNKSLLWQVGLAMVMVLGIIALLQTSRVTAIDSGVYEVDGNPSCADLNADSFFDNINSDFGFKIEGQGADDYTGTFQLTSTDGNLTGGAPEDPENSVTLTSADGVSFDWTSTLGMDAVIVKGGPDANAYVYVPEVFGDEGLTTPDGQEISHVEFCYDYELDVTKTAFGTYDRTHTWDIEKSVDPLSQSGFAGETLPWTWTVNVSETYVDSDFAVNGTITINNPAPTAVDFSVVDTLNGVTAHVDCDLGADGYQSTGTVPASSSVECAYHAGETDGVDGDETSNTVTVTSNTSGIGGDSYTETITWQANVINGTAVVDDDQESDFPLTLNAGEGPWEWTEDQSHTCSSSFSDYGADGTYGATVDNDATVTGSDGQSDEASASTTYTCYAPVVDKDAAGTYDETHTWDIEKSVDPLSQSGFAGETLPWTWTVNVSETSADGNFDVTGKIYIENPAGEPMEITLADAVGASDTADIDFTSCTNSIYADGVLTIDAGQTAVCDYSALDLGYSDVANAPTSNTATATLNGIPFAKTVNFSWQANVINGTAVVDDDQESDFPLTLNAGEGPWEWTEDQSHTCSSSFSDYGADGTYGATVDNDATVTGSDGQSDEASASTTYTCEAGTLDVLKYTEGVVDSTRDWQFALYIGPDGFEGTQVGNTGTTLGDADGILDFGDPIPALRPDMTYTVCELDIPAGWSTDWSIDGMTVMPYNPNADDDPSEDLGNRCIDVGAGTAYPIAVGQNLRITVNNTFPGGGPRTPGYWKNWSSCSPGNQFDKATGDNDPDNEFWTLDELLNSHRYYLGLLELGDPAAALGDPAADCEDAVNILDHREVDSGDNDKKKNKKRANDPAYKLARNLLAYELNQDAGACYSQDAEDAALAGHALLLEIEFDGTGPYLRSKDEGYAEALRLARILDDYNNGIYCQ